jgi:ribosomal protein L11 methylase PrmA
LVELAEPIAKYVKSGCLLALSGILSEQIDDVLTAYSPWIDFDEAVEMEQSGHIWARLTGRKIEG